MNTLVLALACAWASYWIFNMILYYTTTSLRKDFRMGLRTIVIGVIVGIIGVVV